MSNYTEQQIKHCACCGHRTTHLRNNSRMGAFGWIVNIILVIFTSGLWLIAMLLGWVLTRKIGGWECSRCLTK